MEVAPQDPSHIQASACCKHYVANSMDASTVAGVSWNRENFDASVTMQDLVDSYMAPFQACVERGKVSGMMCSYNAVNGVPSCANDWLLAEVARNDWGFDGYITSDCDADADVFRSHHYTSTPEEAVRDVLHAGTDVDCGGFTTAHAQSALDKGLITEADIDRYHFLDATPIFEIQQQRMPCLAQTNHSLVIQDRRLHGKGATESDLGIRHVHVRHGDQRRAQTIHLSSNLRRQFLQNPHHLLTLAILSGREFLPHLANTFGLDEDGAATVRATSLHSRHTRNR